MKYKCLECGHVVESSGQGVVRCSNRICQSYWIIPLEKYEAIINGLMGVISDDTPVLDIINGIVAVLSNTGGITGRPLRTLEVARRLVEEAERRKKEMMRL